MTVDIGTSSTKAVLYNGEGRSLPDCSSQRANRLATKPDGGAIFDADELVAGVVEAIDEVLQGHKYMSAALTGDVLALMSGRSESAAVELTSRQQQVLRLIVNGQRMKEIAASLDLSPRTVETIKYEMMRDLDVHSTPELVRYAIEHRLVVL